MQILGLGSGIDIDSLIESLMAVEETPKTTLSNKKTAYQQQLSAWTDIKTKLTTLQSKIDSIRSQDIFRSRKTGTSNSTVAAISASAGAALGTYHLHVTSLATSTTVESSGRMGNGIDPDAALKDSGLATAVTKGSISINGVSIAIDPETDSLNDVLSRIEGTVPDVSASFDSGTGKVTFSYTGEGSGTVQLGSGADTGNFFKALWVDGQTGTSVTSTVPLGSVNTTAVLSSARFSTVLDGAGEFEINGVKFSYDASKDALQDIIEKINSSDAQVTASYDLLEDTLTLTAKYTGSKTIQMADLSGNFLEAVGINGTAQSLGQNAVYTIDEINGGNPLTSSSNSISEILAGVTFTLKGEGDATLTVSDDTDAALNAVKAFVSQYNTVMGVISPKLAKEGLMQGDTTLTRLQNNLRRLTTDKVSSLSDDLNLASQIGITIDKDGVMTLDETKFKEAFASKPGTVYSLFNATDGIASRLTEEINAWVQGTDGIIPGKETSLNKRIEDKEKEIETFEARLEAKRALLVKQFSAMDQAIATLNSTSSWLTTQLNSLLDWGSTDKD